MWTAAAPARAQQLGAKILAGIGIDAGTQPALPGLYVLDRAVYFTSHEARDRNGDPLPISGLDVSAFGNAFGLVFIAKPEKRKPVYLTFAASLPAARIHVKVDNPFVTFDQSGLSDFFVQPLKLGWRGERHDAVLAYSFYAPTGKFEVKRGAGVGRGHWSHDISVGGAAYTSKLRGSRASALVTYEINGTKRGIDIKRGSTLQIQGGVGVGDGKFGILGIAGYALWQVTDDSGSDLPDALRGIRTRVFGLGPEANITIAAINMRFDIRMEWDFGVRARLDGNVLAGGLTYRAWGPTPQAPAADK